MQFNKHIFLTGFMGCGKTSNGSKLAKLLKVNFTDLDYYIEQQQKITISSLFENFGETAFRRIEQACLKELIDTKKKSVIALGGGTICFENNLEIIKNAGLLVYIELPAITLQQRLENSKIKRPLLKNLSGQELLNYIAIKLAQREPFYNASHLKISGLNLTSQVLQQKISEYNN